MSTTLYLLRHAASAPSPDVPEADWPLSAKGERQADALVTTLSALGLDAVYSSPYLRARATVAPFAAHSGLEVTLVPALRERRTPWVAASEWLATIERAFAEPRSRPGGGESNAECAVRMTLAVGELVARHPGANLLVSGHGNAIAIYLGTIDPDFGFEQWRAMKNPDLFRVRFGAPGNRAGRPSRVPT